MDQYLVAPITSNWYNLANIWLCICACVDVCTWVHCHAHACMYIHTYTCLFEYNTVCLFQYSMYSMCMHVYTVLVVRADMCIIVGIYTHNSACISASSCGILVCVLLHTYIHVCMCIRSFIGYCLLSSCAMLSWTMWWGYIHVLTYACPYIILLYYNCASVHCIHWSRPSYTSY